MLLMFTLVLLLLLPLHKMIVEAVLSAAATRELTMEP
jgi:hypothetical protein